ncbi:MAG: cytochrome C oxidase subunit IV family protein [Candidatus Saccharimonas sp.]
MEKKQYTKAQVAYTFGYVASAGLTLIIYVIASLDAWREAVIAVVALAAAVLQLVVQSRFFLHLKRDKEMSWQLGSYIFAWVMLLIVVIGSLWVMFNLNYNMGMSPDEMLHQINVQNTKGGF